MSVTSFIKYGGKYHKVSVEFKWDVEKKIISYENATQIFIIVIFSSNTVFLTYSIDLTTGPWWQLPDWSSFPRFLYYLIQTTYPSILLNQSSNIHHAISLIRNQCLPNTCRIKSKLLSLTLEIVHNLAATWHPIFTSPLPKHCICQPRQYPECPGTLLTVCIFWASGMLPTLLCPRWKLYLLKTHLLEVALPDDPD
jgi:hypothetical protein